MTPPGLIIDGHNLIGSMPGFSLSDMDDEDRLLKLLQVYARARRKRVEVFFDGAPPGRAGARMVGTIQAVFVPAGRTADAAIRERLAALGKQARGVSVVSSDRQVQAEARSRGAATVHAWDFARELVAAEQDEAAARGPSAARSPSAARKAATSGRNKQPGGRGAVESGPALSPKEVDEWLELFQKGKDKK